MTIFFRSRFFFNKNFSKKHFKVRFSKQILRQQNNTKIFFQSAAKGAVAIARYYFYSVTGTVEPLLTK